MVHKTKLPEFSETLDFAQKTHLWPLLMSSVALNQYIFSKNYRLKALYPINKGHRNF